MTNRDDVQEEAAVQPIDARRVVIPIAVFGGVLVAVLAAYAYLRDNFDRLHSENVDLHYAITELQGKVESGSSDRFTATDYRTAQRLFTYELQHLNPNLIIPPEPQR